MPYIIGVVLALLVAVFARVVGLEKDRAFYPTVMIVIALIYVLFAVMSGSMQALVVDGLIMIAFVVMAVIGFKRGLGLVALALVAHGVMDTFHGAVVSNPGRGSTFSVRLPLWSA